MAKARGIPSQHPMTTIIGIDPSLTRTAVAVIQPGLISLRDFPTKGTKTDTLEQRYRRIDSIRAGVDSLAYDTEADTGRIDLVVIEGPAHGQTTGHHHDRSGLWWKLAEIFLDRGDAPVAEITPSTLKVYATGKGNAGKDQVMLATARRYAHLCDINNNDQADALTLAAAGWHHTTGQPLADLPQTHTRALDKVTWPHPTDGSESGDPSP